MTKLYDGMERLLQLENKYGVLRLGYYVTEDNKDTFQVYFKGKNKPITRYVTTHSLRDALMIFANRGKGVDDRIKKLLAQPSQERMLFVMRVKAGYVELKPASIPTIAKTKQKSTTTRGKKDKGSIPNTSIHPRYDEFINIAIECHNSSLSKNECIEYLVLEGCPIDLAQKIGFDLFQNTETKVLTSNVPDGYVKIKHRRGEFVVKKVQMPINYSAVPNRSRYNQDGQKQYFYQPNRFKTENYGYTRIA